MKVSVLMPVYNTKEEYLREAIESILNQTFTDFEFIILDDCSANDVESIVKSYKDDRIKFYKNEVNLGIAKTRNKLMDLANGEYIALMDNDDISLPERLKKQVEFLDKNPDISIVSSSYEIFPNKQIIMRPHKVTYLGMLKECIMTHPSAFMRKEQINKYNLKYDSNFIVCQDYELWSRAIRYVKFANITEILLKYRQSKYGLTTQKIELAHKEEKIIQQNMLDFLTDDDSLQENIKKIVFPNENKNHITFLEKIFSVKNNENKKIIRVVGIKIIIPRKKLL